LESEIDEVKREFQAIGLTPVWNNFKKWVDWDHRSPNWLARGQKLPFSGKRAILAEGM